MDWSNACQVSAPSSRLPAHELSLLSLARLLELIRPPEQSRSQSDCRRSLEFNVGGRQLLPLMLRPLSRHLALDK